ncbi:MAG: putative F0F1-ATPase [Syntrophorhabdus sp. PtaB.Bin006]|nr:MAG: putative F0F1-ATPase [Syntrophorhabdus sp. PtaB.Bin006]
MIQNNGSLMIMSLSENKRDVIKSLLNYSSLGLEMGLSVAIGIGIGYFLDSYFKTYPYLTIIFMLFGIVAAMKTIFMLLKKIERENREDERNKDK